MGDPTGSARFISFPVRLGDVSRRIEALILPLLGPDQILRDNDVMLRCSAVLDWKNERSTDQLVSQVKTTMLALRRGLGVAASLLSHNFERLIVGCTISKWNA